MGWFIFGFILLIVSVVSSIVHVSWKRSANSDLSDASFIPRIIYLVALVVGIVIIGINSFTIVPPRNVGIPVVFGKADHSLDNGFHWVAPWANMEQIDGTVQTQIMTVTVRLANQTTADVDVVVQWNVNNKQHANELWQRYRGKNDDVIKNIHDNVVWRQTTVALNAVFASYNPLQVLTGQGAENKTQADLATSALEHVRANVDPGIVIDTLAISLIHYDPVTQEKLNGYAQALADTQIATQQKLTAEQQKLANEKLAVSSSNDPGVKYQNCLNMLNSLAAKGQLQNLQYGGLMCAQGNPSLIIGK